MLSIAVFVKKSQCSCPLRVPIKVIRVAMAETLETSQFTSVQRRIQSLKEEAASKPSSETTVDSFLSPLKIDEKRDPVGPYANQPENVAATNISKLGAWHLASWHLDTADKSQSSRRIPCAVYLESRQKLDCERHGGACLHLLSAVTT